MNGLLGEVPPPQHGAPRRALRGRAGGLVAYFLLVHLPWFVDAGLVVVYFVTCHLLVENVLSRFVNSWVSRDDKGTPG